jgi:hypothetical protein
VGLGSYYLLDDGLCTDKCCGSRAFIHCTRVAFEILYIDIRYTNDNWKFLLDEKTVQGIQLFSGFRLSGDGEADKRPSWV